MNNIADAVFMEQVQDTVVRTDTDAGLTFPTELDLPAVPELTVWVPGRNDIRVSRNPPHCCQLPASIRCRRTAGSSVKAVTVISGASKYPG